MSKKRDWQSDAEYVGYVADLLAKPEVPRLAELPQLHYSHRLENSISVSYQSYLIGKRLHLNVRAIARAGLLHDLFYYDWRKTKFDWGTHSFIHPRIALRNSENLTEFSPMEKDSIV